MPTALLSVYDKTTEFLEFASRLGTLGWTLLASTGTKKALDAIDVSSVDVGTLVGEPILGHRVVTLDRRLYAAILADITEPSHMAELKRIGVEPIHLVCVGLYPLAAELSKAKRTFKSVIEQTDIGGPTLLRAAAKGRRYVISNPWQYGHVLSFLENPPDNSTEGVVMRHRFLSEMAAEAEKTVARYADISADFHLAVSRGHFRDRS